MFIMEYPFEWGKNCEWFTRSSSGFWGTFSDRPIDLQKPAAQDLAGLARHEWICETMLGGRYVCVRCLKHQSIELVELSILFLL